MPSRDEVYVSRVAREIRAKTPERLIPDESNSLFLLYALLALTKGQAVTRRDVHDAWVTWMYLKGASHESMRPFEELDQSVQAEDEPFRDAIAEVAVTLAQ